MLSDIEAREQYRVYLLDRRLRAHREFAAMDNPNNREGAAYWRGVIGGLQIAIDALELDNVPGALSGAGRKVIR